MELKVSMAHVVHPSSRINPRVESPLALTLPVTYYNVEWIELAPRYDQSTVSHAIASRTQDFL